MGQSRLVARQECPGGGCLSMANRGRIDAVISPTRDALAQAWQCAGNCYAHVLVSTIRKGMKERVRDCCHERPYNPDIRLGICGGG
jgi:hypothetical protein